MGKNTKFSIRKGEKADLEIVYCFERNYIQELEPENLERWDKIKAKTTDSLANNLESMVVAVVGEELAGYGYWNFKNKKPCIYSIYIGKEYRGAGIARALISSMEQLIRDAGYTEVTLETLVKNPAQYLFNSMNYTLLNETDGWLNYSKQL